MKAVVCLLFTLFAFSFAQVETFRIDDFAVGAQSLSVVLNSTLLLVDPPRIDEDIYADAFFCGNPMGPLGCERDVQLSAFQGNAGSNFTANVDLVTSGFFDAQVVITTPFNSSSNTLLQYDGTDNSLALDIVGLGDLNFGNSESFVMAWLSTIPVMATVTFYDVLGGSSSANIPAPIEDPYSYQSSDIMTTVPFINFSGNVDFTRIGAIEIDVPIINSNLTSNATSITSIYYAAINGPNPQQNSTTTPTPTATFGLQGSTTPTPTPSLSFSPSPTIAVQTTSASPTPTPTSGGVAVLPFSIVIDNDGQFEVTIPTSDIVVELDGSDFPFGSIVTFDFFDGFIPDAAAVLSQVLSIEVFTSQPNGIYKYNICFPPVAVDPERVCFGELVDGEWICDTLDFEITSSGWCATVDSDDLGYFALVDFVLLKELNPDYTYTTPFTSYFTFSNGFTYFTNSHSTATDSFTSFTQTFTTVFYDDDYDTISFTTNNGGSSDSSSTLLVPSLVLVLLSLLFI